MPDRATVLISTPQTSKPPQRFKTKTVFFVKSTAARVDIETIRQQVSMGEIGAAPLETLHAMAQGVFIPLLTSTQNQRGWPDVVAREVTENLHKFVANVSITLAQTKGSTMLPLPEGSQDRLSDKDRVYILESAVVTWTKQIKSVLKGDPDAPLKIKGNYPGPMVELDFWADRAANLNAIYDQLNSPKIQKIVAALEAAESTYHGSYQRLFHEVETAKTVANDNVKFLKPLRKYLDKLNMMDDWPALVDLFKPIFHLLLLTWKHSNYFNAAPRVVTLLRECCNDLIYQACKFLPGADLLQMDPNEAVDKLRSILRLLAAWKSYYFDYKDRSAEVCPDNPWKFQNNTIFSRLDAFMERCHDMLDLQASAISSCWGCYASCAHLLSCCIC